MLCVEQVQQSYFMCRSSATLTKNCRTSAILHVEQVQHLQVEQLQHLRVEQVEFSLALDRKYHFLPSIALVRQVLEVLHMVDNVFLASVALVRQKCT